jgi:translocation protein SEC63
MAGISGSDESFIAFCFAIVSIVMMFLYFPVIIGCIREGVQLVTGSPAPRKKRYDDDDPDAAAPKPNWRILLDDFTELPRVLIGALRYPGHLVSGIALLWNHRTLATTVFLNDAVRFVVRPRFIFLLLWIFLLSSAMYASITFDPYATLGLPNTADTNDVKRSYRKLSKINHPDHNKTDEAKVIYNQVRRAYKALVDRDAFDKDVEHEEMTVGIALPTWMVNHEHDGKILIALLALLIGVPYLIWKRFKTTSMEALRERLMGVSKSETLLEPLFLQVGVPLDPKFIERRREKRELAEILVNLSVLPVADEGAVDHFPPLADVKRMCLEPYRNDKALQRLGIVPPLFDRMKAFFESYELDERMKVPEGNFTKTDKVTYETLTYIIDKSQQKIRRECQALEKSLEMLLGVHGVELRTVKKLERLHKEFLDTLADVYKQEKPNARDVRTLIETPQKRQETLRDLPREIQQIFENLRQNAMMREQQAAAQQQRRR